MPLRSPHARLVSGARRRSRTWRRAALTTVAIAAVVLGSTGGPGAATADPTTPGSAAAKSATVTSGSGVVLTQPGTGVLPALTTSLAPVITAALNLSNTVSGVATTALTSTAGLQAVNGATQQPRPTPVDSYPVCNQLGWVFPNGNCFAVVPPTATPSLAPSALVALSAGTVQGYATGDDQGFVAAAGSVDPILAVPGLSIDLGVASSNTQCRTSTCTPTHSFTGGTVKTTAGVQTFALASGQSLATIGGTSISDGASVPIVDKLITAKANGNLLTFNVTLTLDQFLGALGTSLSTLSAGLAGALSDAGSSITLVVSVGPGDIAGAGGVTASAWGLQVGISLIADINLSLRGAASVTNVLGSLLGSAELETPGFPAASTSSPNLLDLKFAYSTATAGVLLPGWVPPALI